MKKKPPPLSSSLNLGKVFASLLERLPFRGTPSKGGFLKDRRFLLSFILLVGASLLLLKGALMRPAEPEPQPLPPPPQEAVTEPPTVVVASPPQATQLSPSTSSPQKISPPRPPAPQNQIPELPQRENPKLAPPLKKERSETPKVPRDPFLYPQKADERSPRTSSPSPDSLSPSSLPPPPLPSSPSLEKLPPPPSSLSGQNGPSQSQKPSSPVRPTVVGIAFGEKALVVLSFPGEGEVPLFVGEAYKGWKVVGIEKRSNAVLVRVKTPDGKEITLKHQ